MFVLPLHEVLAVFRDPVRFFDPRTPEPTDRFGIQRPAVPALRLEASIVVGMVGLNPEVRLPFRPEFDDAGLVVSIVRIATAVHGAHVMASDREAPKDCGLRRPPCVRTTSGLSRANSPGMKRRQFSKRIESARFLPDPFWQHFALLTWAE